MSKSNYFNMPRINTANRGLQNVISKKAAPNSKSKKKCQIIGEIDNKSLDHAFINKISKRKVE